MSQLRFKVGDLARLVRTQTHRPHAIGKVIEILHVGPFKAGEMTPAGHIGLADHDYVADVPGIGIRAVLDEWLEPIPGQPSDNELDPALVRLKRQLEQDAKPKKVIHEQA